MEEVPHVPLAENHSLAAAQRLQYGSADVFMCWTNEVSINAQAVCSSKSVQKGLSKSYALVALAIYYFVYFTSIEAAQWKWLINGSVCTQLCLFQLNGGGS